MQEMKFVYIEIYAVIYVTASCSNIKTDQR